MLCSICFNDIPAVGDWTTGNNAEPINSGRCCQTCDNNVVFPARLTIMLRGAAVTDEVVRMRRQQFESMRQRFGAEFVAD